MTLSHRVWAFIVLALGLSAASGVTFAADGEAGKAPQAKSAKESCKGVVEAAKKGDFETFRSLSTGWGMFAGKNPQKVEKGFNRIRSEHMDRIKELNCGSEHVAGDHAVVEAEAKGEKRLVPFVQEGGAWKFDARSYMAFYRDSMQAAGISAKHAN